MRWLLALPVLFAAVPASAETVYLLVKSAKCYHCAGIALHSLPMKSLQQCEGARALIISSARFDLRSAEDDAFECIKGK